MVVRTYSSTHSLPDADVIEVEASIQNALPSIILTGLPGDVVKESRERIRACLHARGFDVPSARVVIHLSPASAKKQGSQLDLAIAMAFLAAEGLIRSGKQISEIGFLGELSIDGRIRGVRGALALAEALEKCERVKCLVVPLENFAEVALLRSRKVIAVKDLSEVLRWMEAGEAPVDHDSAPPLAVPRIRENRIDKVRGQGVAKRALQIALAGRHHLLLAGPPGVGKTLIATSAPSLLPPLEEEELIALVKNAGTYDVGEPSFQDRPFRSPHHSISAAGLLGGGSGAVESGEVTLAHGGILFLDEFPEFRKDALEGLREPLQAGVIHLKRVGVEVSLPARFLLIAAMNPCPCGYSMDYRNKCTCPPGKAESYRKRISGPLFDRMDLFVLLSPPSNTEPSIGTTHQEIQSSIQRVYQVQKRRYGGKLFFNSEAPIDDISKGAFAPSREARDWLDDLCAREFLSFRSIHKTVRVARTIADLFEEEKITLRHVREAWSLRCRDFSKLR